MNPARILRHFWYGHLHVRRIFPPATLEKITQAIAAAEARHHGQIRFAVEASLDLLPLLKDMPARARALQVFANLGIWDTEANNGVLIYLLLADRTVEIIADRGIHVKVGEGWTRICGDMEKEFRQGRFEQGVLQGIAAVGRHLESHFPRRGKSPGDPGFRGDLGFRGDAGANELPDAPVIL